MNSKMLKICFVRRFVFKVIVFLLYGIALGCNSTKNLKQLTEHRNATQNAEPSSTSEGATSGAALEEYGLHVHYQILMKSNVNTLYESVISDSLFVNRIMNKESPKSVKDSVRTKTVIPNVLITKSTVANKMVENYLNSDRKTPGGHCLTVSRTRFEIAYKEVHGHSLYQDLPDSMATISFTPKQVFNMLYASASEPHQGWRSLPEKYRGKGNAGAIAYAGMGTIINTSEIWNGQLQTGALMQVWRYKEDYEQVAQGANVKKLDPYGHSFIFIGYIYDEDNAIIGIKIADQGFQSYRPLVPSDYEVWWAVNLSI